MEKMLAREIQEVCRGFIVGGLLRLTFLFLFSGPLIAKETGKSYSQIGVVSWGIGCAGADAPGVYSRVTSKLQWIQDNKKGSTCPMET